MNKYNASVYHYFRYINMLFSFIQANPSEILLLNFFFFQAKIIINYILNKLMFLRPTATSSQYIPKNGCSFGEFCKEQ